MTAKTITRIVVVLSLVTLVALCRHWWLGTPAELYSDQHVEAGEIRRFGDFMAVHYSRRRYLKIFDTTYMDVQGELPCYLSKGQTIVFSTRDGNDTVFHIANLDSQTVISVNGGHIFFDSNCGSPAKIGEECSSWIEYADNKQVILGTRSIYPQIYRITIDLESGRLATSEMHVAAYMQMISK